MPGQCANIGEKDTLFKDREPQKTIPNSAARTYIEHIVEYHPPPPGGGGSETILRKIGSRLS